MLRWVPLLLHRLHRLPLCQLAELLVSRSPRPRVARSLSLRLLVRLNLRRRDRRANMGGRSLSTSVEGLQLADGSHRWLSSRTYEVLVPSKYPRMATCRCETEANWIPPNPPTTASWSRGSSFLFVFPCFDVLRRVVEERFLKESAAVFIGRRGCFHAFAQILSYV